MIGEGYTRRRLTRAARRQHLSSNMIAVGLLVIVVAFVSCSWLVAIIMLLIRGGE